MKKLKLIVPIFLLFSCSHENSRHSMYKNERKNIVSGKALKQIRPNEISRKEIPHISDKIFGGINYAKSDLKYLVNDILLYFNNVDRDSMLYNITIDVNYIFSYASRKDLLDLMLPVYKGYKELIIHFAKSCNGDFALFDSLRATVGSNYIKTSVDSCVRGERRNSKNYSQYT